MTDGELVIARGDNTVSLESVDPALDRMALAVVGRVEARRPTVAGAELLAVACLVGLVGDGAEDPAAAQAGAVPAGGVRLVGPYPIGTNEWPARPDAGHANLLQHQFELWRVSTPPCRHHDRHGLLTLFDSQVQLGGEAAARASQPVITRLGEHATRRFLLLVALFAGPGRVLVGAAHRGVDAQVPDDRAFRVGQGLEPGEDPLPGTVPLSPAEQVVHPVPRSVLDGDVPPRNAGTDPEPYAVDRPPPRLQPTDEEAHRGQLRRLRTCAALSGVSLRILALSHRAHAGLNGPFILLETPDFQDPDPVDL